MEIKRCLTNSPILVLPYFNISFELHVDVSMIRIRAIPSQEGWLVAYFSEKLSEGKLCCSTYDIELYVVI